MKKQTKAFTLVELIVVIVILAILWTIAFISFQGYSRNSRDWVRIADINSAKKSLEIFITKAWFYPTPDNGVNITYSWAIVWTEGTLWSNVTKNIQSLNKVITDPLTANEYTYSITSSKTEYQIWWISEWWWLTGNIPTDNTYAADLSKTSAVAYIGWNYNEKFTKVNSWTISWILAQPSIISTDKITSTDLANILANKKLAYNNYTNIPSSFSTPWTETGWFNYSNPNPIIYSWTLEDLHDDNTKKLAFITNLKQAYASTDLATNPIYEDIMSVDTTTDSTWAINLAITFINSNKWGIKLEELALLPTSWWWTITYSCATQPTYTHASYAAWTATQANQTRQNTNSWNPCYYTCTDWYSWSDCSTAPIPTSIADCTWQNTPTPFSSTTTYWEWTANECSLPDIIVCKWAWTWYTISACNVWATTASTDWTVSRWKYFQWWRNKGFVYGDTSQQKTTIPWTVWLNSWTDTYWFVWSGSLAIPYTWANSDITNNWGETTNTSIARQWPCATWYHVPSKVEWASIFSAWQWLTSSWADLHTTLKMPCSGFRDLSTGNFTNTWINWWFWSSSTEWVEWWGFSLLWCSTVIPNNSSHRAYGLSVRCIKN